MKEQMTKEEIYGYVDKIMTAYKSIPHDALRNSITYEPVIYNNTPEQDYIDLNIPIGMFPQREIKEIYVGFYPVYFYSDGEIGMLVSYFSAKTKTTMKFGPFRTPQEFVDEFMQYEGIGNFDFICNALKADSSFIFSYDEAYRSLEQRLKRMPKLPLMNLNDGGLLGVTLNVAVEYIINPYCYDQVMIKMYDMSDFRSYIASRIAMSSENHLDPNFWVKYDYKKAQPAIKKIKESIKKRQKEENWLLTELKNI